MRPVRACLWGNAFFVWCSTEGVVQVLSLAAGPGWVECVASGAVRLHDCHGSLGDIRFPERVSKEGINGVVVCSLSLVGSTVNGIFELELELILSQIKGYLVLRVPTPMIVTN